MSLLGKLIDSLKGRPAAVPSPEVLFALSREQQAAGLADEAYEQFSKAILIADPALGAFFSAPITADSLLELKITAAAVRHGDLIESCLRSMGEIHAASRASATMMQASNIVEGLRDEPGARRAEILRMVALFLGFSRTAPKAWVANLFDLFVEPLLLHATDEADFETALALENLAYSELVLQIETGEHFKRVYQRLAPPLCAAGRARRSNAPALPDAARPVIGFVLNNASILAHTEVLLSYLEGLAAAGITTIAAEVLVLSGPVEATSLKKRLDAAGIPVFAAQDHARNLSQPLTDNLYALQSMVRQRSITALVWVSFVPSMAFAYSLRIAPVQIWWAMKYHELEIDDIDGYVTGGSLGRHKRIGSRLWRAGPLGVSEWRSPQAAALARPIREGYLREARIILGCFGREEKLNSAPFLSTVCDILKRNPEAVFLWTGRQQSRDIQEHFDRAGVAPQCRFIGWVDTRTYAEVIDIFIDSFPFPCGFTAIQAMAAGRPVVFYQCPESWETGVEGLISPLLKGEDGTADQRQAIATMFRANDGSSLFLSADDPAAYAMLVQCLIDDAGHRDACGAASRAFVEQFLSNPALMAQSYTAHFLEIIAEVRSRHAAPPRPSTNIE